MIIDLESQLTRIRDYRTRAYFADAVRCFRAGAFRSALAATWVTVAYDLIVKYRELSTLGDAEARQYIADWDQARASNNTSRLLELERNILAHAHDRMAIVDAIALRGLSRLYEDRHLCSHPAFSTQDDLYDPPADLVRAHMTIAVDALLAQPPVQGRGIFETFSVDIQSSGFPSALPLLSDYVERKYIRNMRPNVLHNFGIVLAKSAVRNVPEEWAVVRHKVAASLVTLQERAANSWPEIETEIIRLINEDAPANRARVMAVLKVFPLLVTRLNEATLIALHQTCTDATVLRNSPEIFEAAALPEFRDVLVRQFEGLEDAGAAAVLRVAAPHELWASSLARLSRAGGWRAAEALFDQFVIPFSPILTEDQLSALLTAIQRNGQIWDAGGTPGRLAQLLGSVAPRRPSDAVVTGLYTRINRGQRENYEGVWAHMEGLGWQRPTVADNAGNEGEE